MKDDRPENEKKSQLNRRAVIKGALIAAAASGFAPKVRVLAGGNEEFSPLGTTVKPKFCSYQIAMATVGTNCPVTAGLLVCFSCPPNTMCPDTVTWDYNDGTNSCNGSWTRSAATCWKAAPCNVNGGATPQQGGPRVNGWRAP